MLCCAVVQVALASSAVSLYCCCGLVTFPFCFSVSKLFRRGCYVLRPTAPPSGCHYVYICRFAYFLLCSYPILLGFAIFPIVCSIVPKLSLFQDMCYISRPFLFWMYLVCSLYSILSWPNNLPMENRFQVQTKPTTQRPLRQQQTSQATHMALVGISLDKAPDFRGHVNS
jgi:hypothetical protein